MATNRYTLEAVFKAVDRITAPVARMSSRVNRFSRRLSSSLAAADRRLSKIGAGLRKVGAGLTAIAIPAGLVGAKIIKTGADFEEAISAVGAVGLKTRGQIADLESRALQLGATTKFTATEAAQGMEIMARAGFSNKEILSGISGVLDAAAASGMGLAEVSDHVSNVLKGMGLATSEATRVADVLALASSRTNSSIGSLGESMRNVSSTARELKIPLESAVAGVALLQDVGLDASVAGSAMNTMLTKLAKPPKAIARQMKKLGISFKDAKGNMLPFGQVIGNINKASKAAGGNFDKVAFLADLVGLRGQKAASNLANLFETGKLEKLTKKLKHATKAASKMAKLRMDNLKGDITLLGSAVDGVGVSLYNLKGGKLREVVQSTTKWIDANKELIVLKVEETLGKIQKNWPDIVKWTERAGYALGGFLALHAGVKVARGVMLAYEGVVILVTGAQKAWTLATKAGIVATGAASAVRGTLAAATAAVTGATWASVPAFTAANAALLPMLATAGAIAAALASMYALYKALEQFGNQSEGLGVTGTIGEMWKQGTWDPAKAIDTYQNQQAQTRALEARSNAAASVASAPSFNMESDASGFNMESSHRQIVSPERVVIEKMTKHVEEQDVNVNIMAAPGLLAQVDKTRPKGGPKLSVPASGSP